MTKCKLTLFFLFVPFAALAQTNNSLAGPGGEIDFISDTQQPMLIEELRLKPTHNKEATSLLFSEILRTKPQHVYMLGDVVALGFCNHKWKKVDRFLDSCHKENISVYGLFGNHDVMLFRKKGERNFNRRFPQNVGTGYLSVTDSIAVLLLNSNFKTLSAADKLKQDT